MTGSEIREYRLELGMSQAELARRCGCNRAYICAIEKGRERPAIYMLRKIKQVLRLDSHDLEIADMADDERKELHEIWCERYGD
jgi:transcriptional regulator with XRE-family HTH domain